MKRIRSALVLCGLAFGVLALGALTLGVSSGKADPLSAEELKDLEGLAFMYAPDGEGYKFIGLPGGYYENNKPLNKPYNLNRVMLWDGPVKIGYLHEKELLTDGRFVGEYINEVADLLRKIPNLWKHVDAGEKSNDRPNYLIVFQRRIFAWTKAKVAVIRGYFPLGATEAEIVGFVEEQEKRGRACFSYAGGSEENYELLRAIVVVDWTAPKERVRKCLHMEMLRGFGLFGVSRRGTESVMAIPGSAGVTELDFRYLATLYGGAVRPGMTLEEFRAALAR